MKLDQKTFTLKDGKSATLSSAQVEDAQDLLNHLKISHQQSYRLLDRTAQMWEEVSVDEEEKIIKSFLEADRKLLMVARINNIIVAGMGIVGDDRPFRIHSATLGMSIQSSFQNIGLGSLMMETALCQAKEVGLSRLDLAVRVYNKPAIALYEKYGFQKIGLIKNAALIDGKFVDEFSYQKII